VALRRPRTVLVAVLAVVVLAAVAVPVTLVVRSRQEADRLRSAAQAFATAWRTSTLDRVAYAAGAGNARSADGASAPAGAAVARQAAALVADLTPAAKDAPAAVEVTSVGEPADGTSTAGLAVRWSLSQGAAWSYATQVPLRLVDGTWRVVWSPAVVHPSLRPGLALAAEATARRGRILGAGGTVLVQERPVVYVGIDPGRVRDPGSTAEAVAALVDVDAAALARRVAAARAGTFVDVITLRRADYDRVRARLRPIPGTVFREGVLPLGPTPTFARALLGTVGQATAEIVRESDGRVAAGDLTGLSGLQRAYDERLSGTAGVTVRLVRRAGAAGGTAGAAAGAEPPAQPLLTTPPKPGEDVATTIDPAVQVAAEAALAGATKPAGLVALRPSTGEVLAVANGGPAAEGYNRALLGQYPPGSTFKIVSTLALLRRGVTPSTTVPCPPTVTVQGRAFRNAENEVLGTVPFRTDFAHSCNTAFVGSAPKVSGEDLQAAATALGFDATQSVGTDAFTGSAPATDDPVEHAANMIGQGKVLGSPLSVATATASVAAGRRVSPSLVTQPAPDAAGAPGAALPARVAADLRSLMRSVVTTGTGTALRSVPGGPVHGKTGTAEYGGGEEPPTHAWFTGFQGDVAFALVVEDGGFGGRTAAPLAADFLRRLR
jgi:cell division protein FtsI/penicillin-binding protein 2